ncbi:MAG: coproporphyrinogen dehydrogenase HemZ [Clostridiales bacterium]|nr:coproporphyrinogen dehydrogenase HemZ [Clostridiales bacterium]
MTLWIIGHSFRFEMENLCRLFVPREKITVNIRRDEAEIPEGEGTSSPSGITVITSLKQEGERSCIRCAVALEDFQETAEEWMVQGKTEGAADGAGPSNPQELRMAQLLYGLLVKLFCFTHDWGIVTGVRPIKLLRRLTRECGETAALAWFRDQLLVGESKLSLCRETLEREDKVLSLSRSDSFSLYVSIPFCPTRCDYCSFVSQTVVRAARLIPEYVELLAKEIALTGAIARRLGLRLETVYFGGGTPTTLTAEQLALLLRTVEESFDLSHLREYTVEAGRPDTVTEDKLRALRAAGVSRVSINPQTLSDPVLEAIGRKHTAAQFYEAFALARRCGFGHINADLIAGLPQDSEAGFRRSLDGIIDLGPESITVHALAMKRASNLVVERRTMAAEDETRRTAVAMTAYSRRRLSDAGYGPYYLYRQSRSAGNQENVGWCLPGHEGLYNVYIMDETHTILACGAGAVTKLKQPGGEYIERIFNYKFPYEYNRGFAEMAARKERVTGFYEENPAQTGPEAGDDQPACAGRSDSIC